MRAAAAILVVVFGMMLGGTAVAAEPSNIGPHGDAAFSYQDLADGVAKPEGGYTRFDSGGVYYREEPRHHGYDTTTDKCKVCHAVHRAEGAYELLRADSQADACDYCHVGNAAHSRLTVYDLDGGEPAMVLNGHTTGAASYVPDSTTYQEAKTVTVSTADEQGRPVSASFKVRSYDESKLQMYRFSRHHSQSPVGTGRSGFIKRGPFALTCLQCHQQHAAPAQMWRPKAYDNNLMADYPNPTVYAYKMLRRYPSGTTTGPMNAYGMYDLSQTIKVPETTLAAGVNYSSERSGAFQYKENGVTATAPIWISQGWDVGRGTGPAEDPATVNTLTLSVWCADCHNLDIGGATEGELADPPVPVELGFKSHGERTHPAPFVGAHTGPGQCYSCHRNDLSVQNGVADPAGYGSGQPAAPAMPASAACTQCHYGTQAYYYDNEEMATSDWVNGLIFNGKATATRNTDFPHSGKTTDIKLLGSYTTNVAALGSTWSPAYAFTTITEDNLDAVCIRCHPGVGVHN